MGTYVYGTNITSSKHIIHIVVSAIVSHTRATVGIKVHSCKVTALVEGIVTNTSNSSGNGNRSKTSAAPKGIVWNIDYAIPNIHSGEVCAVVENGC